jgi:uncharacterized RDD family membrane protein YckC
MHCKHCGFANGDDDHRCLRCGRRLSGVVIAAPPGYSGANALAPSLVMNNDTEEFVPVKPPTAGSPTGNQPTLFTTYSQTTGASQNVIPFDRLQREAANRAGVRFHPQPAPPQVTPQHATGQRRKASALSHDAQGTLDFIPGVLSKGRKLKTDVDAQVFCDQPVATPTHRFVASAIDGAMIMIGFGLLVVTFQLMGGSFGSGKLLWIRMASVLGLVAMFYGLIWAIAGRETAGMRVTDLQLITFDGFPLDGRSRALRFASAWLSFCSGGLGMLWAVADEENLTWHDHISKTFPTVREIPRTFVRQKH